MEKNGVPRGGRTAGLSPGDLHQAQPQVYSRKPAGVNLSYVLYKI